MSGAEDDPPCNNSVPLFVIEGAQEEATAEVTVGAEKVVNVQDEGLDSEARRALPQLVRSHQQPLLNFLHVLVQDDDLALDCLQDTFVVAWEHLEAGKSVNSQWLYKVARSRAIDALRARKRVVASEDIVSRTPAPYPVVSEESRRALGAMAKLSREDRELLYLFLVDCFSTEEIAQMLGIRGGAVRVRLTRARKRFQNALGVDS